MSRAERDASLRERQQQYRELLIRGGFAERVEDLASSGIPHCGVVATVVRPAPIIGVTLEVLMQCYLFHEYIYVFSRDNCLERVEVYTRAQLHDRDPTVPAVVYQLLKLSLPCTEFEEKKDGD